MRDERDRTGAGVIKTHDFPVRDFPRLLNAMPELKIVNMTRDPADILVSRLLYCRHQRPSIGLPPGLPYVETIGTKNDTDMINESIGTNPYAGWIREWTAFFAVNAG